MGNNWISDLPSLKISIRFNFRNAVWVTLGIIVVFWVSLLLPQNSAIISIFRRVFGVLVFTLLPGTLITLILNIRPSISAFSETSPSNASDEFYYPGPSRTVSIGEFLLFSTGMSLLAISGLIVVAGLLSPILGFDTPLSPIPITALTTVLILTLLLMTDHYESAQFDFHLEINNISPVFLVYCFLPTLAALAAGVMNVFNSNVLMYVFVLVAIGAVILLFTKYVSSVLYPSALFSISISTLFHRNLITHHVLGADIQFIYFVANLIKQTQVWSPNIGGELLALPIVTSFPATLSLATGIGLSAVFKVIFAIIFSLVPIGIFYVSRYIFDDETAVVASLLYLFYHLTFYFTPGKQLIAEMYIVLLLLVIIKYRYNSTKSKVTVALLITGVVFSHHGVAYVYGFGLFASSIFMWFVNRYKRDVKSYISFHHSLGMLSAATLWYAFVSPELLIRIVNTPIDALAEIHYLLTGEITQVGGSGESFVTQLALSPEIGTLVTYFLITLFTLFGVGWITLSFLTDRLQTPTNEQISLTALAFPLSIFLVSSYLLPISLWADRVYQMVLPVLSSFLALGYRALASIFKHYNLRSPPRRTVLPVLVCLLFLFNSGFIFALLGAPTDPTFSSDAHDLAFTGAEYQSGLWLKNHADIHRVDFREAYPSVTAPNDSSDETRIYVDQYTYQIYRSTIPSEYYNIQYIYTKNEWKSNVTGENISPGYVIIRNNSIVNTDNGSDVPLYYLTTDEVKNISNQGNLIYNNRDITIYEFNASAKTDS